MAELKLGYKASAEQFAPRELVELAVANDCGLRFHSLLGNSDQNEWQKAEAIVAALQTATPVKITLRGPIRSAIGPEIADASAKTIRLTSANHPNCEWLIWNVLMIGSVIP